MKANFIKLTFVILIFAAINSYSASIWENITFPEISSTITAVAVRGNYIYLGTSADGFFYSSDAGGSWRQPENKLNTINIKLIATKGTDLVFVFSDQQIYTSSDNCVTWVKHSWFMEVQENIQCYAFGPSGNLYLGTDKNVWKSIDDAKRFTKISTPLEKIDARAIAVNGREYIYASDFLRDAGEIFRTKNSGTDWERVHKGIDPPYKAKSLFVCSGDVLYALIENLIYTSTDYGDNWEKMEIPDKDKPITRMRPNRKGDLIIVQGNIVSIWDITKRKWISGKDELLLPVDISDLVINDDDGEVLVIGGKGIYKSKIGIDDIIKNLNISYDCKVINSKSQIVPNTTFDMYLNNVKVGSVTTNEAGIFSTSDYTVQIGDLLKIEKKLHTEYTVKGGHANLGNIMYETYIDNSQFANPSGVQSDYKLTNDFEPTLILNHTTLRYNLLVSVEWDANKEFLDTLQNQFRKLSNYLYDVTDGQLYFNQVDIYDNREQWDNCDVQIFANNMVWPNANVGAIKASTGQVHMPRLWLGDSDPSRNNAAKDNWIRVWNADNYRTIGHELGHYLFGFWDEYVYADTNWGKYVPSGYNYGFMDYQYPNGDEHASEMSAAYQYSPSKYYKSTAQWVYNGSDCWTQFRKDHEATYNGVFSNIYFPIDRTGQSSQILIGPNNNLNSPDCNVGAKMFGTIHNADNGAGTAEVVCYLGNGPFPNVDLALYRPSLMNIYIRRHLQGRTADNGYAKILGASVNDMVRCSFMDANQNEIWVAHTNIYQVTPLMEGELMPTVNINMVRADGDFLLDNELRYNENRKMEFVARPQKQFDKAPGLEVDFLEQGPTLEKFPWDENLGGYKYEFDGGLGNKFETNIVLYDSDQQEIPVPVEFQMNDNTIDINSANGDLKLTLDPQNSSGIDNVPVAETKLFSSRGGLNKDAERGSDIFYIASYPNKFLSNSNNALTIRYNKTGLVKKADTLLNVYRWNYEKRSWERLGGQIDTAQKSVSISINSTGCYALFTYDPLSGVNDNKDRGMLDLNITPNPARDYATAAFVLSDAEYVTISITNSLGIEVAKVLDNQLLAYGRREFKIPCINLPNGVYFCTVRAGNIIETTKLMINN